MRDQIIEAIEQCPTPTTAHGAAEPRIATMTRRSEILDEGFQICAPDCRAEKDMQARRINDLPDFIRNPIKADFQSLDDGLLLGNNLPLWIGKPPKPSPTGTIGWCRDDNSEVILFPESACRRLP